MDDAYLDDLRELYRAEGYHELTPRRCARWYRHGRCLAATHDRPTGWRAEDAGAADLGRGRSAVPDRARGTAHALIPHSRLAMIEGAGHTPRRPNGRRSSTASSADSSRPKPGPEVLQVRSTGSCRGPDRPARPSRTRCGRPGSIASYAPGQVAGARAVSRHTSPASRTSRAPPFIIAGQPPGLVRPGVHHPVLP